MTDKDATPVKSPAFNPKPRPSLMGVGSLDINYAWFAEYMATHEVPLETAVEHALILLHRHQTILADVIKNLETGNKDTMNRLETFIAEYKVKPDYFGPIKLVTLPRE